MARATPVITSAPVLAATAGQAYAYQVMATDANPGDTLTFSLPAAPAGMSIDPATGQLITGDVEAQTHRAFDNLQLVLEDAGLTMDDVIKCNVYLTDMANFAAMNLARPLSKPPSS